VDHPRPEPAGAVAHETKPAAQPGTDGPGAGLASTPGPRRPCASVSAGAKVHNHRSSMRSSPTATRTVTVNARPSPTPTRTLAADNPAGSAAVAHTIHSGGSGGTGIGETPAPSENATGRHQAAHAAFSLSVAVATAGGGEPGAKLSERSVYRKHGGIEVLGADAFTSTHLGDAATQVEHAGKPGLAMVVISTSSMAQAWLKGSPLSLADAAGLG